MTQANFERNLAVQQVTRLKQEIDELSRDRHAVCPSIHIVLQCHVNNNCVTLINYFCGN